MKTNTPNEEAPNNSEQNNNSGFKEGYSPISSNISKDDQVSKFTFTLSDDDEDDSVEDEIEELPETDIKNSENIEEPKLTTEVSEIQSEELPAESIVEESSYERLSQMVSSLRENAENEEENLQASAKPTEVVNETPPLTPPPLSSTPPLPPIQSTLPTDTATPPPIQSSLKAEQTTSDKKAETPRPDEPKKNIPKKKQNTGGNKTILYVVFGVIALGLIGGGILYFTKSYSPTSETQTEDSIATVADASDENTTQLPDIIEVEVEESNPQKVIVEEPPIAEVTKPEVSIKETSKQKAETNKKPITETKQPEKKEPVVEKAQPVKENIVYPLHTTIKYPTGNVYTGYINAAGKKEGQGTYSFASGDKYVGNWINDQATGQGTYYSREGWKYVGSFVNLKFHGQGVWHFADGKTKKGVWENGVMKK